MTATATVISKRRHLRGHEYVATVAFTSNYPAVGDTITAASMGLSKIEHVTPPGPLMGAALFFFGITPVSPDTNGLFASFKVPVTHLVIATGVTADHAVGAYEAEVAAATHYIRILGF